MIHAASVACVRRLQSYKFGRTVTVPVTWQSEFPKGVYSGIKNNLTLGLHSLVLLEIDVEDKRHVSIPEAIKQLVDF